MYNLMEKHSVAKHEYVNVILCLLAVSVMSVFLYGIRVVILMSAAVITAIITDFICAHLSPFHRREKHDASYIVTALVVTLLLPATAPFWVPIVAVSVSIVIAKYPFGGNGHNIFNPAAAGLAFCAICWPEYVLRYPAPEVNANVVDGTMILYAESPASILAVGGTPKIDYFDVALGKFAGPMGATCMLVLLACLIYLVLRRIAALKVVIPALGVVALVAIVAPRVNTGIISSLIFEGSAGALLFGLIFMANDPVTLPKTSAGKLLYGVIIGGCVVTFRHFGQVELEFVYAILIANIFAIPCDRYANRIRSAFERRILHKKYRQVDLPQDIGGTGNTPEIVSETISTSISTQEG